MCATNRRFSEQEWQSIQTLANELLDWLFAGEPERTLNADNEELTLKLATLRHDNVLPQTWLDSVRRSVRKQRERGRRIERPFGYLLNALDVQARHAGRDIGKLLKSTAWPCEHNTDLPAARGGL